MLIREKLDSVLLTLNPVSYFQLIGLQFSNYFPRSPRIYGLPNAAGAPRRLQMLPYAFTVIVLVIGSREAIRKRLGAPAALGTPYIRGERGK